MRIAIGLQQSLSSRYKIYCNLLLIVCYIYALDRLAIFRANQGARSTCFLRAAIAVTLIVNFGGNLIGARFLSLRKSHAERAMQQFLAEPESASPMFLIEETLSLDEKAMQQTARQEMEQAIKEGIYSAPGR